MSGSPDVTSIQRGAIAIPAATLAMRLRYMAFGWGSVGLVYFLCAFHVGHAFTLRETVIDHWLSFTPSAVWIYMSFFLLIPSAYVLGESRRLPWLAGAMALSALVSGICFIAWPSTLQYPQVTGHSLSAEAWRLVATIDSEQNCLPSLHASLTLLSVTALLGRGVKLRNALLVAWGVAVLCSIVMARRHLALDVGAGLICGLACAIVSWWFVRRVDADHRWRETPNA